MEKIPRESSLMVRKDTFWDLGGFDKKLPDWS